MRIANEPGETLRLVLFVLINKNHKLGSCFGEFLHIIKNGIDYSAIES